MTKLVLEVKKDFRGIGARGRLLHSEAARKAFGVAADEFRNYANDCLFI
jgi:hypothetical protein